MKTPDEIKEEQSNRVFWVIQTIFSLLIASSLVEYKTAIVSFYSPKYYMTIIALILIYLTVLWSWLDYSYSTIVSPYDFGSKKSEKARFAIDLFIVITYSYLLFSLEDLQKSRVADISSIFYALAVVFLLYLLSGLLRIMLYGRRASRIWLITFFGSIFLFIALMYSLAYRHLEDKETINFVSILIAIIVTIIYRATRSYAATRKKWIAVDVDGVLADQIKAVLPIINGRYNMSLSYEDVKEWALKINGSDIAQIIKEEQKNKHYILSMPAMPNAKKGMSWLIRRYKIAIVTARAPETDLWTKKWLSEQKIGYDTYINKKEGTKQNIDVDHSIMIDDYLHNIQKYLENSGGKAILFSHPWNKQNEHLKPYMEANRLIVAQNWQDLKEKLRDLER